MNFSNDDESSKQSKEAEFELTRKTSDHPPFKYNDYIYIFKRELVKTTEYRCKYRDSQGCKVLLKVKKPNQKKESNEVEDNNNSDIDIEVKGPHTCEPKKDNSGKSSISKVSRDEVTLLETNDDRIRDMMKLEPMKGKLFFYEKCVAQNIKVSKSKIKDLLNETREEIFPSKLDVALSDEFCRTKDEECFQTFLQYKGEVRTPKFNKQNIQVSKPFIIFASIFMLKQLEEKAWFLDATFSIVPSEFYQVLTVLVYVKSAKTYIPACYILMGGGKHETIYTSALYALVSVCKGYGIFLNPTDIMTDFEKALRNGLKNVFPSANLRGCYFHYCQCLWRYASKHGMRTEARILQTRKLIILFKILPHLDEQVRKQLIEEIKKIFINSEKVYKEFLTYYENNWLTSFSIDFDEIESPNRLVRTNNVCEKYNQRLTQKLLVKHPRTSIFVSALLKEEEIFKKKVIGSLSQVNLDIFLDECSVDKEEALPFTKFNQIMLETKKKNYNLRNVASDEAYKNKLLEICEKCENFIFLKLKTQAEYDKENENDGEIIDKNEKKLKEIKEEVENDNMANLSFFFEKIESISSPEILTVNEEKVITNNLKLTDKKTKKRERQPYEGLNHYEEELTHQKFKGVKLNSKV